MFNMQKPSDEEENAPEIKTIESSEDTTNLVPDKCFISTNIIITGDVISEGELRIDGIVKGNVRAFAIIIGKDAEIEGDMSGDAISIQGQVIGNLKGSDVKLLNGSTVRGNIAQETLQIDNGAVFEGQIKRLEEQGESANTASKLTSVSTPKSSPKPAKRKSKSSDDASPVIIKDSAMILGSGGN